MASNPHVFKEKPIGLIVTLAVVGLLSLLGGLFFVVSNAMFERSAAHIQAKTVDLNATPKTKQELAETSNTYEFTVNGKIYRGTAKGSHQLGEMLDVEYSKANPADNRAIKARKLPYEYVFVAFGAVLLFIAAMLFFRKEETLAL